MGTGVQCWPHLAPRSCNSVWWVDSDERYTRAVSPPESTPRATAESTFDNTQTAASGTETRRARASNPIERTPTKLGRYEILSVLGRGGMGIVYSARDPELDRVVALKVLTTSGPNEVARARMRREARTLAKLAHPNVVAVFDVGEEQGQLYLAMEQVTGGTLKTWLHASERGWTSVLEMFVAAGRGLIAAHEAGLVHRDFKPDNVLIDDLGQPRVVDFGLARVAEEASEQLTTSPDQRAHSSAPQNDLTRPGAIMGTPAYMAPEQHLGDETDARADQFSFCVSLWEGLYGERPFAGASLATLTQAVVTGQIRIGPNRGVPRAIRAVLLRGLSVDPRRRWPTLAELLAALEAVPRRRRFVGVAGLIGTLSIGLVAGTWVLADDGDASEVAPVCVDTGARVDAVWSDSRRSAVAGALDRAGGADVGPTRELVLAQLDDYAATLAAAYEQACLDTEVRQLLSPELRDRRVACLQGRVDALDATTAALESIDRASMRQATQLVQELPGVARCADVEHLAARLPDPSDPDDAAAVARARRELATAKAALTSVRIEDAAAAIERASAAMAGVDHPPVAVELEYARTWLSILRSEYEQSSEQLAEVYHRAFGLGHDDLAIEAGLERIDVLGLDLDQPEQGIAWARHVEALIERNGDALARADLLDARGRVYHRLGEYEQAVALFEQALTLRRREQDPRHLDVAGSLNGLSNALDRLGRLEEARAALETSLSIKLEKLGEYNPSTAGALTNLGMFLWKAGDYEGAIERHQHALAVFERAYGPKHRNVAGTCLNLVKALHSAGRAAEALPLIDRALTIVREADAPMPGFELALVNIRGAANYQLGHLEAAKDDYEEELALVVVTDGEGPSDLASPLLGLAEVANAMGEHRQAIEHANRVLALQPKDEPEWDQAVDAHLSLAEACVGLGEREQARTHAVLARDGFAKIGGRREDERREAEAILAKLDGTHSPSIFP